MNREDQLRRLERIALICRLLRDPGLIKAAHVTGPFLLERLST